MLLGCIGDDFTGSSDLANTLTKAGMRTLQYGGVPAVPAEPFVEAGVVALKTRTVPPAEAVERSLAALEWLLAQGCRQILFKICSTFDSTPEGNIGPVADALLDRLGAPGAVVCPAFPGAGRTVFQGHLFVGDRPLNESGMENHPLTPMRDADIRRWLAPQTRRAVGHVPLVTVFAGQAPLREAIDAVIAGGRSLVVVDAVRNEDLVTIGQASAGATLLVGGSGIALGLPANFREQGLLADAPTRWAGIAGAAAILSGSCSTATRAQVERHRTSAPALEIVPDRLLSGAVDAAAAADWARERIAETEVPLIYTSADPASVRAAQGTHGRDRVAGAIDTFFAELARRLVADVGVSRLVVAGGETSGAVVEGLALPALEIGPEIAPGVPALRAADRPLALALKSGNFGQADFFETALATLGRDAR